MGFFFPLVILLAISRDRNLMAEVNIRLGGEELKSIMQKVTFCTFLF